MPFPDPCTSTTSWPPPRATASRRARKTTSTATSSPTSAPARPATSSTSARNSGQTLALIAYQGDPRASINPICGQPGTQVNNFVGALWLIVHDWTYFSLAHCAIDVSIGVLIALITYLSFMCTHEAQPLIPDLGTLNIFFSQKSQLPWERSD